VNRPCFISLADYVAMCRGQRSPASQAILQFKQSSQLANELACLAEMIGALQPLSAWRPDACVPKSIYDDVVEVGPATLNPDGSITETCKKAIVFCAPMDKAIVIDKLRVTPANLTAIESGQVKRNSAKLSSFSEDLCVPGEAGDGSDTCGTFWNTEHIILCPQAFLLVTVCNCSPYSNALFNVHAESWTAC
jgi:hypothetical protein